MDKCQISQAGFDLHNAMTAAMFYALMAYKFGEADYLDAAKKRLRNALALTEPAQAEQPVAAE